jgi:hypothetical protein
MILSKLENISDNKYPSRLEDVDYSEYKKICDFPDYKLNQGCDEDASDNNDDTEDLTSRNILERENSTITSPDNINTIATSSVILCKGVAKSIAYFDKKKKEN